MSGKKSLFFILFFFTSTSFYGQLHAPAIASHKGHNSTIGWGISSGIILQRNAYFLGGTLDYSKYINDNFTVTTSLTYDQEREKTKAIDNTTNTFTIIGSVSYTLSKSMVVSTGLAKGFADDDNNEKNIMFANADWSTGVSFGYAFPKINQSQNKIYSISSSLEYNITKSEFSISVDLGIGFSFK